MVDEVLIHGVGNFKISDNFEEVTDRLKTDPVLIGNSLLEAGEDTDLDGYFNLASAKFVGYTTYNEIHKVLYFYYGHDSDLFGGRHFFQLINWIDWNRIYITFSKSGGRDFNFINGKWDWERKSSKIKE